jgi:hypothetical protein|tara:strand:- start:968 stop:1234 length:267 start_codon:yes stop_codon:yes gene_type:complete
LDLFNQVSVIKGGNTMKDTMKMVMEVVGGIKELLLHIVGLGVLVQLVFVGGFLGIDIVGNLIGLVNTIANAGFAGFIALLVVLGLLNK